MPSVQAQENDVQVAGAALVARDFVSVDWSKVDAGLQGALVFQSSLRIERVQLWATDQLPLVNGAIAAKPNVPTLPTIQGQIVGLEPLNDTGALSTWEQAHSVAFTINATASVTLPKTTISAAITALNPLAGLVVAGLLSALSSNVVVTIGHTAISVPIVRDGSVVQIGSSHRS